MMSLIEGVPDSLLEDGRHSKEDFKNAINEVEKFRDPKWEEQKVGGIGPDKIWLRDEKYKYMYETNTGRLYGVLIEVSDKALEKQRRVERFVPVTWKRLN